MYVNLQRPHASRKLTLTLTHAVRCLVSEMIELLQCFAIFGYGSVALQTGSTTSTSMFTAVSGAVLLAFAWAVCAILIGVGATSKRGFVLSTGIIPAGTMTIVTPVVYYISETLRLGVFPASVLDFILLAALSSLGG